VRKDRFEGKANQALRASAPSLPTKFSTDLSKEVSKGKSLESPAPPVAANASP